MEDNFMDLYFFKFWYAKGEFYSEMSVPYFSCTLFLNSFIQDLIANFSIACWVPLHPNANTFMYFFIKK